MPMLTKTPLYAYWESKIARRFKSRRMAYMLDLMAPYIQKMISIGLLEHIEPTEKMSRVLLEARRVGRAYVHVMPCVSTFFEPHKEIHQ